MVISMKYLRTVTFLGSYCSMILFILSIFVRATFDLSVMPSSWDVSSLKISSARRTKEASWRSALLSVQLVTAWSSSSVTLGFPFSSRKLVRERNFGSTTRCTKGISKEVPKHYEQLIHPFPRGELSVIPSSIQHITQKMSGNCHFELTDIVVGKLSQIILICC